MASRDTSPDHVSTTLTTPAVVRWRTVVAVNGGARRPSTKRVVWTVRGGLVGGVDARGGVEVVDGTVDVVVVDGTVDVVVEVEVVVVDFVLELEWRGRCVINDVW